MEEKIIGLIINSDIQGLNDLGSKLVESNSFNQKTLEDQSKVANALKAAGFTKTEEYINILRYIEEVSNTIETTSALYSRIQKALTELQ